LSSSKGKEKLDELSAINILSDPNIDIDDVEKIDKNIKKNSNEFKTDMKEFEENRLVFEQKVSTNTRQFPSLIETRKGPGGNVPYISIANVMTIITNNIGLVGC